MRRMNKKGIFYSLSVVLFLIFLIIVFNSKAQIQKKEEQSYIGRAQLLVMDHFVKDFGSYYTQNILEAATKPALAVMTKGPAFTRAELKTMMKTGTSGALTMNSLFTTDSNLNQAISTLSFLLDDNNFDYEIIGVEQVNWTTLRIEFEASYYFKAFNNTWSKDNKRLKITVPVYGLWHPYHNALIDADWEEDTQATQCYAGQILSVPCTSLINIRPPQVCPNGIQEGSEQCDGTQFGGEDCVSLGFSSGTLACSSSCTFITSGCI